MKAIKEAKIYGDVDVVASSKDKNYTYIPAGFHIPHDAAYFHYTTNNTIEGTQMHHIPDASVPLIADMSSDILSREMDFNKFAFIYAGAQKNIGAAGVNLVVADRSFLAKGNKGIPSMMDYTVHVENGSMLNTPPVFAIYVCMLTLRWLKKNGGIQAIESANNKKAALLYDTLDANSIFTLPVEKKDRSLMNAVFTIADPSLEALFLKKCESESMIGIKGHRNVGGFRVSLYNALPLSSVQVITDLMNDFAKQYGS
jgi:phosphoserine aminotransferase